jgi:hypothetical protein
MEYSLSPASLTGLSHRPLSPASHPLSPASLSHPHTPYAVGETPSGVSTGPPPAHELKPERHLCS